VSGGIVETPLFNHPSLQRAISMRRTFYDEKKGGDQPPQEFTAKRVK